jgi:hypothetical protein
MLSVVVGNASSCPIAAIRNIRRDRLPSWKADIQRAAKIKNWHFQNRPRFICMLLSIVPREKLRYRMCELKRVLCTRWQSGSAEAPVELP